MQDFSVNRGGVNPLPALLKYFRKKAGLTQVDVAASLAISRSGYANYEEGRTLPSLEQTIKLCQLLNHDLLYAYTVSARYMRQKNQAEPDMVCESNPYLDAIAENSHAVCLLNNYRSLSDNDRDLVDNFVMRLSQKSDNSNS